MDADVLTNLAVSDVYEPGSTFKLVTYSAALDGAGVQPDDIVDCQNGAMTMYGRTLHDDHSDHFGVVTVQYALEHSSDVGAVKMALKVGQDRFYKYMKSFGFGDRSGIELPSETRGLLRNPHKWSATSIMSLAIGQEVGVTPIQLVTIALSGSRSRNQVITLPRSSVAPAEVGTSPASYSERTAARQSDQRGAGTGGRASAAAANSGMPD